MDALILFEKTLMHEKRACDYNLYSPVPNNLHSHRTIVSLRITIGNWRIKENGSSKAPSQSCHHWPH